MTNPESLRFSRRQFVATSGLLGFAATTSGRAQELDPIDDAERIDQVLYENRELGPGHPPLRLDPKKTVLAVIDMQRYFVHEEHPFGRTLDKLFPGLSTPYFHRVHDVVVPNCQKLQKCFRTFGTNIVYTLFGSFRADGKDMPGWARADNAMGVSTVGSPVYPPVADPSAQVDDSLAPQSGELILHKNTSGPLNSTKLDQMLRTLGIDTLVVTGVVTDVCVIQTAREFADRDFNVVVVEDACATFHMERHRVALSTFADVFGNVCRTATVLELISATPGR